MSKDRGAAAQGIATLLSKLSDPDPDIRFMQLSDLSNILVAPASAYLSTDNHTAARVVEGLLKALGDQHGDVQNQALKCVAPLATRMPGEIVAPLIDKLTNLTNSNNIDVSVPNTALRTLIASLPQTQSTGSASQDAQNAYTAISKVLIPRLVGRVVLPSTKPIPQLPPGLLEMHGDKGYSVDAVDVLIEVVKCYGDKLQEPELAALSHSVMAIVESPQAGGVVKKRSLAAMGALLTHFGDPQLSNFVSVLIESFRNPHLTANHRRYLIATVGTLARATPAKFGPYLKTLAPFVLSAVSQEELNESLESSDEDHETDLDTEELRETALVSLESLLASCSSEMLPYLQDSVDAALRYLRYDPNVAATEDEDMGGVGDVNSDDEVTEEAEDDDDDEYADLDDDDVFSDVDDVSWKARRCAAKVLFTIISASTIADHIMLFGRIAPALISRMSAEREENVKLEILATLAILVRKSGPSVSGMLPNGDTRSVPVGQSVNPRKRRRQDSGASLDDFEINGLLLNTSSPPVVPGSPPVGPQAELAALIPGMVQGLTKLWKKASGTLKQAAVTLLKSLTLTRNAALADYLQQIEDAVADALESSHSASSQSISSSTVSSTTASLQIETLSLISTLAETNPSSVLLPFVIALIPGITSAVRNRNFKVCGEALGAIEQFVKALTPPRLPPSDQDVAVHVAELYNTILERVADTRADVEVRQRALHVLGIALARSSSTNLLSTDTRASGFKILRQRLGNETTRVATARAIGIVCAALKSTGDSSPQWVRDISLELGAQLRKSDRVLRGSCIDALKNIALNPITANQFDLKTIQELEVLLLPQLTATDYHLLTSTMVIFARIIPTNAQVLVTPELVKVLCSVVQTSLSGSALKAFLLLVKTIAEQGAGHSLMKGLLGVGTTGDAHVVGRAIGTLVVSGGPDVGVSIPDFLKELQHAQDDAAVCLALAVLGEVGFRMGPKSPLEPETFTQKLTSNSDKVSIAAATALGSAGAGDVPKIIPVILEKFPSSAESDYLYLHSVKEILAHPDSSKDLGPYAQTLWKKLFDVCKVDDNRGLGTECIGRLALIDPDTFIPELQQYLQSPDASIRGTVISAFRSTLADVNGGYGMLLEKIITPFLRTMLGDSDMDNRKQAVTTLTSAIHNKPELVVSDLDQLLPTILNDSYIKPELIRIVPFGPFKIPMDDGAPLRKSCYEALYELLDTPVAIPHLSIPVVFDRVVDGIPDEQAIRTVCTLMLRKLSHLDPDETRRRLSSLAEKFRVVLGQKVKENAVKQEIEKVDEANAGVVQTTMELDRTFPSAATDGSGEMVTWRGYLDMVKKDFAQVVRSMQDEGSG